MTTTILTPVSQHHSSGPNWTILLSLETELAKDSRFVVIFHIKEVDVFNSDVIKIVDSSVLPGLCSPMEGNKWHCHVPLFLSVSGCVGAPH